MNEENKSDNLIDSNFQRIDISKDKEINSPSRFLYSSDIDFDRTKELNYQNNNLSTDDEAIKISKEMGEVQSVSLFQIYSHLSTGSDTILTIFAVLGSLGAGLTFPLMIFTTSDVYSKMGNTTETDPEQMKHNVESVLNDQIKTQIFNGVFSFTCYFVSIFFWSLVGNRCIYKLKQNYFTIILRQEQGWFDSNNPLEISTKVNSEIEDIEQGIGDKVGVLLTLLSQCIAGFIFGFISSWKLTLTMCSVLPVTVIFASIFLGSMTKGTILSKKIWGEAGGIIEEIL